MAKKSGGPNKSQAIREYYAANPEAKPKAVVEALAAQGIVVSAAFVSTIKSTSVGKPAKKRGRPAGKRNVTKSASAPSVKAAAVSTKAPRAAAPSAGISIENLVKAKGLVRDLGGIDNAISALAALKRLAD